MAGNIIQLLKDSSSYVSGERMSAELGITRAAVWKKITLLRKKGFIIDALPSKGYRLVSSPDLSEDELSAHIRESVFWKKILFYKSTDSTNERALSLSLAEEIESGTVIVADMQDKGRGRLGRSWVSPPRVNVYMSIMLRPDMESRNMPFLTIIAGVVCARVLRNITGLPVSIKWPNDLICFDRKLGGILTEARSEADKIVTAIIGIGINVNSERRHLPSSIRSVATSLRFETGKIWSRTEIVAGILDEFEKTYMMFINKGKTPIIKLWKQLSSMLGKRVSVMSVHETLTGLAEDVDDDGLLMLRMGSGTLKRVSSGDVSILE